MEKRTTYREEVDHGGYIQVKRVYWGAVFAGALIMVIAMMLLNLLGFGIGAGSINPTTEANPFEGLGIAALIWWIISNILAIFAGGYVAGRMAGVPHKQSALLHGVLSWCLYTLFSFWLFTTTIGTVVSGVGSVVSGTFSGVKEVAGVVSDASGSDAIQNMNLDGVEQEVNQALDQLQLRDTLNQLRQDVRISKGDIAAIVRKSFIKNNEFTTNVSREEIISNVTAETNLSRAQAEEVATVIERQANNLKQDWETFKQKAINTGEDVASTTSTAAIWTFIALLVGLVTAAVAGMIGKPVNFLHEEIYKFRSTRNDINT